MILRLIYRSSHVRYGPSKDDSMHTSNRRATCGSSSGGNDVKKQGQARKGAIIAIANQKAAAGKQHPRSVSRRFSQSAARECC